MTERLQKMALGIANALLLLIASTLLVGATVPRAERETEEYAVWNVAISDFLKDQQFSNIQRIVLQLHSALPDHLRESLNTGAQELDIPREVLLDFTEANKDELELENRFGLPLGVNLLDEELEHYFFVDHKLDRTGWDLFYKAFPRSQGLMGLSRVSFFQGGERALVYIENQRYWLGGQGYLVLLRREGSGWRVEGKSLLWLS